MQRITRGGTTRHGIVGRLQAFDIQHDGVNVFHDPGFLDDDFKIVVMVQQDKRVIHTTHHQQNHHDNKHKVHHQGQLKCCHEDGDGERQPKCAINVPQNPRVQRWLVFDDTNGILPMNNQQHVNQNVAKLRDHHQGIVDKLAVVTCNPCDANGAHHDVDDLQGVHV